MAGLSLLSGCEPRQVSAQPGVPAEPTVVSAQPVAFAEPVVRPEIQAWFSPRGGCTAAIVGALERAKLTIHVQAYSFTSSPIAKALVEAKRRGVTVQVILDKSQRTQNYSEADFTAHAGIPTFIDAIHAIAQIILLDTVVETFGKRKRSIHVS